MTLTQFEAAQASPQSKVKNHLAPTPSPIVLALIKFALGNGNDSDAVRIGGAVWILRFVQNDNHKKMTRPKFAIPRLFAALMQHSYLCLNKFYYQMERQAFKLFGVTGRGYAIGFAAWTLYGVVAAGFTSLGTGIDYWLLLSGELMQGYIYGLFTIPVWLFVTTFAVKRSRLEQCVWHLVVAPLYATSSFGVYATMFYLVFGSEVFQAAQFSVSWIFQFFEALLTYGIVASLFHIIHSQRVIREKEKEQLALALYAKQAELATLKAQLNPHFLFNALNAVNALIGQSPEMARHVLTMLSDVLRYALESDKQEFVPLADELRFVEQYAQIEKARFQHRLSVEYEIDEAARACFIPPMLLQPLIENAIRHGIAPKPEGGTVRLCVRLQDGRLRIEASDNGLGKHAPRSNGTGKGLYNTERRLLKMFGESARLFVEPSDSGFRVWFHLPAMRLSDAQSFSEIPHKAAV